MEATSPTEPPELPDCYPPCGNCDCRGSRNATWRANYRADSQSCPPFQSMTINLDPEAPEPGAFAAVVPEYYREVEHNVIDAECADLLAHLDNPDGQQRRRAVEHLAVRLGVPAELVEPGKGVSHNVWDIDAAQRAELLELAEARHADARAWVEANVPETVTLTGCGPPVVPTPPPTPEMRSYDFPVIKMSEAEAEAFLADYSRRCAENGAKFEADGTPIEVSTPE